MRLRWVAISAAALALLAVPAAQPANERATDDDVSLGILLVRNGQVVPDTTTRGLSFGLGFWVNDTATHLQDVTLTLTLPSGLHWGNKAPDAADGCSSSSAPVSCTGPLRRNEAGAVDALWIWDVVADHTGTFVVTATVNPSEPDPNPANNTATFQFDVAAAPTTPTTPSNAAEASAVTVQPSRPRAGTTLSASVRVQGGRPTNIRCVASVGLVGLVGSGATTTMTATCRFRTPHTAAGKMLRGTISLKVGASAFSRHFSTRLR